MLKQITYFALLLAVAFTIAVQRLSVDVAGKGELEQEASAAPLLTEPTPPNQAPAPFGKYVENINGVSLELVRIPTGTFLMGNDRSPNPEEKPAHQVNVRSFFIGRYEITRQQWNIVAATLPRINRSLRQQYIGPVQAGTEYSETTPADGLSWDEALEFCDRLTDIPARNTGFLRRPNGNTPAGQQHRLSIPSEINLILNLPIFLLSRISCCERASLVMLTRGDFMILHGNVYEWCWTTGTLIILARQTTAALGLKMAMMTEGVCAEDVIGS